MSGKELKHQYLYIVRDDISPDVILGTEIASRLGIGMSGSLSSAATQSTAFAPDFHRPLAYRSSSTVSPPASYNSPQSAFPAPFANTMSSENNLGPSYSQNPTFGGSSSFVQDSYGAPALAIPHSNYVRSSSSSAAPFEQGAYDSGHTPRINDAGAGQYPDQGYTTSTSQKYYDSSKQNVSSPAFQYHDPSQINWSGESSH